MRNKLNCWEFMNCGREPGGAHIDKYGICPSAIEPFASGLNDGMHGGRICWAIRDTCCINILKEIKSEIITTCMDCKFYAYVKEEEGLLNLCKNMGLYLTDRRYDSLTFFCFISQFLLHASYGINIILLR